MSAGRARPAAIVLIAILLSSCGTAIGTGGPGSHTEAWQVGYHAGKEARWQHKFKRGRDFLDIENFCLSTAYRDIQSMKSSLLQWTEGFEAGCRNARYRPNYRPG
jgi:hypothetical protein